MAADFSALTAEVERVKGVNASAIALLNGIAARIQAAVDADNLEDNTATAQLAADLSAQTDALASAVSSNP
ncbi:MAG TPA: hypothetical protein VIX17_11525 [Pyrinomonadaceae bacterium]|jgi:hypothetical protein